MAGRYFGEEVAWLEELRDKRRQQISDLEAQSTSIAASGYSKSKTSLKLSELTEDLQEINFEITRQNDIAAGTGSSRPTCSYTDFSGRQ